MKNRYYLMRHGESQANRKNLIISDPEVGCRLYGLTTKGQEQARQSAVESLLDRNVVIVASDFLRTKETARVVQDALRCKPPIWEKGLRERFFGKLEGDSGNRYKEVWEQDSKDPVQTLYGAESPKHLALRLARTMEKIDAQFESQTILLVSHGDTLRFLQLVMATRPLTQHLDIALFKPAEIRALDHLPKP